MAVTLTSWDADPADTSGLWIIQSKDGPKAKWKPIGFSRPDTFAAKRERMRDLDEHGAGVFRMIRA